MTRNSLKKSFPISQVLICGIVGLAQLIVARVGFSQDNDSPAMSAVLQRLERLESDNQKLSAEILDLKSRPPATTTSVGHSLPRQAGWISTEENAAGQTLVPIGCEEITTPQACEDNRFSFGTVLGTDNKFPTVRLTGFFQADAVWANQQPENIAAIVDGRRLGDIQDGADFRRARLAAVGDVWDNVGYMIEFDFAFPGRPSFMDVFLDIRDLPLGTLRVGQWRQPFGMDALSSAKELTFLERGLPFAFLPFRQIGVGLSDYDEERGLTWANSIFRYPTDTFGGNIGDNGGYGYSGRLTWLALDSGDDQTLHLGGNYSYADPSNNLLRFLSQPEFFVAETGGVLTPPATPLVFPPFVDTGLISANNFQLFGTELAGSYGSFLFQSELHVMSIDQIAAPTATLWGAYAQASYVLTGETRPYNKKAGFYTRVVPNKPFGHNGWGAWEIAGRWSTIDLTDKNIAGNELQDWTLGLNWYLNDYTKFQFNYIRPTLDSAASGTSRADLFGVRAQLDF